MNSVKDYHMDIYRYENTDPTVKDMPNELHNTILKQVREEFREEIKNERLRKSLKSVDV